MMYARDYRALARERLAGHWGVSILVAFVATLLGGAVGGSSFSFEISIETQEYVENYMPSLVPFLSMYLTAMGGLGLAQFILGGPIALGNAQYLLDQHDCKELDFKTLFSKFEQFGTGFLMHLLMGLYTLLWGLLFVIPGIVAGYSYAMTPFILAEHPELTANEAIRASKEMMYGHKWELFCLDWSFFGWYLLCALTLGIGNFFVGPYTSAAYAAFYRQISGTGVTVVE